MDKKYILGVDGGNTKTDYFLFDTTGEFIDFYRDGTCSHEGLKDSFEGSYRVMNQAILNILAKNNLKVSDIYATVLGLAGVDTPYQKKKLEEVVERIGFKTYKVVNDSFLGIKAVSEVGVCSICGTGTAAMSTILCRCRCRKRTLPDSAERPEYVEIHEHGDRPFRSPAQR